MPEQSWIITTAVGTGEKGYAGDGGPAARALLNGPFESGSTSTATSIFPTLSTIAFGASTHARV